MYVLLCSMELSVVKIGNSKGIRLPKTVLDQYGILDVVEVVLEPNGIVLRPSVNPRAGWDAAFQRARLAGSDEGQLLPDVFEDEAFDL
jgi:antitoxin MazE